MLFFETLCGKRERKEEMCEEKTERKGGVVVTNSPCLPKAVHRDGVKTRDDFRHSIEVVDFHAFLGHFDEALNHFHTGLILTPEDDVRLDPVADLVEAVNHHQDVRGFFFLVLLGPPLVQALIRGNGPGGNSEKKRKKKKRG